jgi:uncharacterized protein with HEPN domain
VIDDALCLLDIDLAIRKLAQLTAEGHDVFMASWVQQDATIRNFAVIGEAVRNLSPALKASLPTIPWQGITGLRNRVIHDYRRVNLDTVWQVMEHDLPVFRQQVDAIIQQLGLPQNGEP